MPDRTVHARIGRDEVVRYDRAGKWWLEQPHSGFRHRISFDLAVKMGVDAMASEGTVYFGRPGGSTFDRRVRAAFPAPSPAEVRP